MKLRDWAAARGWGPAQTARELEIPVGTIKRIFYEGAFPKEWIVAIYLKTSGSVEPNDFFDLPNLVRAGQSRLGVAARLDV